MKRKNADGPPTPARDLALPGRASAMVRKAAARASPGKVDAGFPQKRCKNTGLTIAG
jgi:hypothetical protein